MADRVRRERRQRRPEVKQVEIDEVEDFDDDEVEEEVQPVRQRREQTKTARRVVVKAPEPEVEDEEDEVAPVKEPKRRVSKPQPEPEVEEEDEAEESVLIGEPLALFEVGKTYQLTPQENGTYLVTVYEAEAAPAPKRNGRGIGLTGKAFEQEVCTPEYLEWRDEWNALTAVDKEKAARKAKVKWDEHDNPNINTMRMGQAYVEKLGIIKHKPEYASRAARAALRGK